MSSKNKRTLVILKQRASRIATLVLATTNTHPLSSLGLPAEISGSVMGPSKSISFLSLLVTWLTACASEETVNLNTLRQVQVVFRHGDRTPTATYPTDPYKDIDLYWPVGPGELTEKGKQQQYELGQFLRSRYNGFISPEYKYNEIYVLSSETDRTMMSAEANLAGLFPMTTAAAKGVNKLDKQPVPVHILPSSVDNMLRLTVSCPRLLAAVDEFVKTSDEYKRLMAESRDLFELIKINAGLDSSDEITAVSVQDPLFCEHENGFKLPSWVNSTTYDRIQDTAGHMWRLRDGGSLEIRRLRGGPIVRELVGNMKKMVANSSDTYKMRMYSAHDVTVEGVLTNLGVVYARVPGYAHAVIVELHQEDTNGKYFVNLYHRNTTVGPPHELHITGCGVPCYFDKMVELVGPGLPEHWEQECHQGLHKLAAVAPEGVIDGTGPSYAVLAAFVGLLTAIILILTLLVVFAKSLRSKHGTFLEVRPILRRP